MTEPDVPQPTQQQAIASRHGRPRACLLWCGGSSYISAGVRHLQRDPRIQVSMRVQLDARGYDASILSGIDDVASLPPERFADADAQVEMAIAARPDVLVVSGWMMPAYLRLARDPRLRDASFIMTVDNQWTGAMRQRLAGVARRSYLRRMSLVVTACDRSRIYATRIGVPASRVRVGCYCCDYDAFVTAHEARKSRESWPRRFLYVGRLVREKGIDEMLEGYRLYRELVDDPWPLSVCGKGPLEDRLRRQEGVEHLGFVQPAQLPGIFATHGAFILPSRYEPWGVVIAEACAAGLPVACSDRCGAGIDLVRDYSNGIVFAAGDAGGIRDAFVHLHRAEPMLPEMGEMSRQLAMPLSAAHWARRWAEYIIEAAGG